MVSIEKILQKLSQLGGFISLLEEVKATSLESFLKDKILNRIVHLYGELVNSVPYVVLNGGEKS